jgi:hypothetical protein
MYVDVMIEAISLINNESHLAHYNFSSNSKEKERLSVQRVQRSGHDSGISCRIQ